MDLRYNPAEQEFRGELREWLAGVLPTLGPKPDADDWPGRREYDTGWQRMLYDAGYAGINWPKEFGGLGATPTEHLIFLEESERAGAPYVGVNFVGLLHAGPTLIAEASPEMQRAHLPGILRGDLVWCQGFSEPGAGSDLASLRCKAVRDGDDYVITGQKIWTSHSAVADFCELLVRTDPGAPKHQGISWLVMPMDAAGITVRPLRTIIGSAEFAEMFLDEVRIPVGNRVGAENDGWRVTNVTLSFERGTAFVGDVVDALELVGELSALAKKVTRHSATAWDDRSLRRQLAHVAAELEGLWALTRRNVSEAQRVGRVGFGGSIFKLRYSEVRQQLAEVAAELLGRAALTMDDLDGLPNSRFAEERLQWLNLTIAAGTSQIQRNIIGERVLGLPREQQR
jgi:alkylation response protein AidB-like acyl-CoA dehydrogenase